MHMEWGHVEKHENHDIVIKIMQQTHIVHFSRQNTEDFI